jgi:hypothetical protein
MRTTCVLRPFTVCLLESLLAGAIIAVPIAAQQGQLVTAADYARAEGFLAPNLTGLVAGGVVIANWLSGERFWYRNGLADGTEVILVDPATKTRAQAFDHGRLASALSAATGNSYDALHLPLESIDLSREGSVLFDITGKRWSCDLNGVKCAATGDALPPLAGGRGGPGAASSYMMRRRWDYFVKWLLGVEPPKEYQMKPAGGR